MLVLGSGDSFVYGSELTDCRDNHLIDAYGHSNSTFPALLSREYEYDCVAWPGYGNDGIARTTVEYCENNKDKDIFVITSWTFPGRYEFRFSYDTKQRKSPWHTITPWTTLTSDETEREYHNYDSLVGLIHDVHVSRAKATGLYDFTKTFYQHVGSSEYWEIYSSLREIVYLQNYLKLNNIPYMFTAADNSIFYNHTTSNPDTVIASLVSQIDNENWFWFPAGVGPQDTQNPRGFYQWAVENKYPVGTTHPLEEAHYAATALIQGKFNELVKKHLG